ncbi:MAG: RHS repeat-associated core domain-containing protein [Undibacterium sp.]|nr:RHS repeat-associated core domain-containing protein [Opitutaceae bacterium]
MNRRRSLPLILGCTLALACFVATPAAHAQVKPRLQAQVPIQLFFAVKSDVNCYLGIHELNTNTGLDSGVLGNGKNQWYRNAPMDFTVIPGVTYDIHLAASAAAWDSTEVRVSAPAGYRVYLSAPASGGSTNRTTYTAYPVTDDHHHAFLTLIPEDGSLSPAVGEMAAPQVRGAFIWSVGLGSTFSRRPVGNIQLRLNDLSAAAFDPASLVFDALTDDVVVTRNGSGVITSINAPQAYVALTTLANGYQLDFGGITIYVQNDAGRLLLTRQTGARTQTWRVTQTGTTPKSWNVEEIELGRTCTYASTTLGNGDRQEDVTVADAASGIALKTRRIYRAIPGVTPEELIQEIADPAGAALTTTYDPAGAALTTTYDYYYATGDANTGRWGRLKSVIAPDGSWTRYDYYGASVSSDYEYARWGQLKSVQKPWQDGPATPDLATLTNCALTLFDYVGERAVFAENAATSETRLLGITAALANSNPAFGATANGQPLRTETVQAYTGSGTYLTTIKKIFHNTADPDHANKLYSQLNPDGTQISSYILLGANYNSEVAVSGWSTAVSGDAVQVSTLAGQTIQPIYLVPNRSTRRTQTTTIGGTSYVDIITEIYTFTGTWEQIGHTAARYDGSYHIFDHDYLTGADTTRQWADGVPYLEIANNGSLTGMSYDALNRLTGKRRYSAAAYGGYPVQNEIYTLYTYDAAGHVLTERTALSSTPSSSDLLTTRTYDYAGRLTSETNPAGLVTTYAYDAANRRTTVTVPGGATQITETYRDGSSKSTAGTGVVAAYQATTVNTDGTLSKTAYTLRTSDVTAPTSAPRWARVTTDWAGRTLKEEKPAPPNATPAIFTKQYYYNPIGRLWKTTEPGLAATLVSYNAWGEAYRSGLHIDGTAIDSYGNLTLVAASLDRFSETTVTFLKENSAWWKVTTALGYNQDNVATSFTKGVTKERLTGFTVAGQVYQQKETFATDLFGNATTQTLVVDRANKIATATTDTPDSSVNEIKIAYNGLPQTTQTAQNLLSRTYYDSYGRVVKQTDPRTDPNPTPLRIGYYASGTGQTGQVQWQQDSAGNQTNFAYYTTDGRLYSITDPLNKTTRHLYNLRGQNNAQWGAATYPVGRIFNDYGELTQQQTFRNGTAWDGPTWPFTAHGGADPTLWNYDPASGVLLSKTDAANKTVAYTYNARGQLATRTWARGVITTYSYSPTTAEQSGIGYSDTTPNLGYAYNRLGQNTQIADAALGTWLLDHCVCGKIVGETFPAYFEGRKLTHTLSALASGVGGRTTGVALGGANATGSDYAVTYGYDDKGRFNQVGGPGNSLYTYYYGTPNSNLISSVSDGSSYGTIPTYEANRDLLASITFTTGAVKARFAYGHDALGRRTSVVESGEIFARYPGAGLVTKWDYNDRSEVTVAQSYFGQNVNDLSQPVPARNLGYAFDNIGSRTESKVDNVATAYANNALNQLTSRTAPASTWVTGLAPTAATVSINGTALPGSSRQGEYYAKNVVASATPLWQSLAATSSLGGPAATRYAFLAATPESYTYDLDGNLTDDGRWHYTWDAENRLTSMETSLAASVLNTGVTRQYISFKYDYLGRRVRKTVANWNGTAYIATVDRKFIYDGWNLLTERDATTLGVVASYVWGLDLSKTLQDGGGVGGLLAVIEPNGTTHLPAYDGNGNIHALVNRSGGAVTAAYEYDAFGQTLRATGPFADKNPFRFSTKYTDSETGLLYYGRRYYNPTLGRWLGRDPIEEKGGLHLYAFIGNHGINGWDVAGMFDWNSIFFRWVKNLFIDDPFENASKGRMMAAYYVNEIPERKEPTNTAASGPGLSPPRNPASGNTGNTEPRDPKDTPNNVAPNNTIDCDSIRNSLSSALHPDTPRQAVLKASVDVYNQQLITGETGKEWGALSYSAGSLFLNTGPSYGGQDNDGDYYRPSSDQLNEIKHAGGQLVGTAHGHPNNTPMSLNDYYTALARNIVVSAVTADGGIYLFDPTTLSQSARSSLFTDVSAARTANNNDNLGNYENNYLRNLSDDSKEKLFDPSVNGACPGILKK